MGKYTNIPWVGDDGYIYFLATVTDLQEHSVQITVEEVTGWSVDASKEPTVKDLYCEAFIKWDGCCHVWFGESTDGESGGYLHLCGVTAWKNHCAMMEWLYKLGTGMIARFDESESWQGT